VSAVVLLMVIVAEYHETGNDGVMMTPDNTSDRLNVA